MERRMELKDLERISEILVGIMIEKRGGNLTFPWRMAASGRLGEVFVW